VNDSHSQAARGLTVVSGERKRGFGDAEALNEDSGLPGFVFGFFIYGGLLVKMTVLVVKMTALVVKLGGFEGCLGVLEAILG
jgi:hypothetical protein